MDDVVGQGRLDRLGGAVVDAEPEMLEGLLKTVSEKQAVSEKCQPQKLCVGLADAPRYLAINLSMCSLPAQCRAVFSQVSKCSIKPRYRR